MLTPFKFALESEVKCKITGYKGIVIGRHQWMHGCNTYSVKSKILKDGKPLESVSFDEAALDLVKAAKERTVTPDNGGPRETPAPTRTTPSR